MFDCTCNTQNSLLLNQHNGDDAPQDPSSTSPIRLHPVMFRLSTGRLCLFFLTYCAHRQAEYHSRCSQQAKHWTAKKSCFSSLKLPEIILFCTMHDPALGFTEPCMKWLPSSVFAGLRRPVRGTEPLTSIYFRG